MMGRQIVKIIFACLIASTFYHDYVVASRLKKKILLKGLVGAGLLVKYLKPKKGILPIPLPMPLPIPIEWEQPPIIVHPKHHHVPIPQPVPMPVHTPVHVPIHHHSKYLVSESYQTPDYASYGSPSSVSNSYSNSYGSSYDSNNYGNTYGANNYGGNTYGGNYAGNYGGFEESYGGSDGYGESGGYGDDNGGY